MVNASYTKRIASDLIDVLVIYFLSILVYVFIEHIDSKYLQFLIFVNSIVFQSALYIIRGQTIGESSLGIKVISTKHPQPRRTGFILRSLVKSFVFVPYVMKFESVATALMLICLSIIFKFSPITRGKKLMAWDVFFNTAVIEGGSKTDWKHPLKM